MINTDLVRQGNILIAQPFLNDGYFKRTVVLLTEHNEHGTMGFVFNKPMHLKLKDVLPMFPDFSQPLYRGGPVADNQLFFIHNRGLDIDNSMPIGESGWYWGGSFEDVVVLLKEDRISNDEIRFFIGYSGWEADQLNTEIEQKSWFVAEADYSNLFNEEPHQTWPNELKRMGSNFAILGNFPEDPSLN